MKPDAITYTLWMNTVARGLPGTPTERTTQWHHQTSSLFSLRAGLLWRCPCACCDGGDGDGVVMVLSH